MIEDDDELAELLADEDRVRDALLAAVDGQLVPPVRTDFAQVLERGRRRARLQVVSASVAAVVLIAAVALGATALGRLGGPDRVSAANGSSGSLPVSSQSVVTTPDSTTPSVPTSTFTDAACVYPGMVGGQKWVPLNTKQSTVFVDSVTNFSKEPANPMAPAVADALPPEGQVATKSVEVGSRGQLSLVTISSVAYAGSAAAAAAQDSAQAGLPPVCVGMVDRNLLGKTPMVNAYLPAQPDTDTTTTYLRVQVYAGNGVRYDVTEAINPSGVADYVSPQLSQGGAATAAGTAKGYSAALDPAELAEVALEVASLP